MRNDTDDLAMKERILLSAIDEFGSRGYDAASTNAIVARAGVSKGLLFHYYGSKKRLFSECSGYVIERMAEYILKRLTFTSRDLFDRIRHSLAVKMQFCAEQPAIMGMAYMMWYYGHRQQVEDKIRSINKYSGDPLAHSVTVLTNGADLSKLRGTADPVRVIGYVGLLLDACWLRFSEKHGRDPYKIGEYADEFMAEADEVIELVKLGAYRAGEG